jgi:hypothetical protein
MRYSISLQRHLRPLPSLTVPVGPRPRGMTLRLRHDRRGSALFLTMVFTFAFAGLAMSAIYLSGNSTILATVLDHERDLKYASDAALAMGKSRLNYDPLAVPDTGYTTILSNQTIQGADGKPIPNITVNMYVGQTSSNTGQYGRFVSVVTQAKDANGSQFVRRLELAQESFAKYAYWSNSESNNGSTIYFGGGDQLWGPVWSNDIIHISNTLATFHDVVGTAQYIDGLSYGTFSKGYSQYQRPITLPNNTTLANLPGYASAGLSNFTAPNSGTVAQAQMRIEFDAVDLNGDGKVNGTDEGFFKVYMASNTSGFGSGWVRGDSSYVGCGASFHFVLNGPLRFVPIAAIASSAATVSITPWFSAVVTGLGGATGFYNINKDVLTLSSQLSTSKILSTNPATVQQNLMALPTAHCYLGGDPHLAAIERPSNTTYKLQVQTALLGLAVPTALTATAAVNVLAGDSTTWTDSSTYGHWVKWTGTIDPRVPVARPNDSNFLFPIYRGLNPGTKGVIYVNGTTGLSGTLRGRITIYTTGSVAILNDLRYATDPALGLCVDILGVISGGNIFAADNNINTPQNFVSSGSYVNYGDTPDLYIQGVLMALNTSFGGENYDTGPVAASACQGSQAGRGCLYLTGGIIQQARGAVGTGVGTSSATGYIKRYSYDQCALYNPPPYFPTTGRYTDNRYYELDPSRFNVAALYNSLTP